MKYKSKRIVTAGIVLFFATIGSIGLTSCEEEEALPKVQEQAVILKAAGDCGWCSSYPICCSGNVDPDGDGWGWEWSRTCIVNRSGPANQLCNGGTSGGSGGSGSSGSCNGYPYCSNGSGDDPDGDGWGWTGSQSCIVSGSGADNCGGGGGSSGGGGGSSSGSCPSSLGCPSGLSCGCYTVSGLGTSKQNYNNAGANRSFLASAMMETEGMNTNYTYGDGKSGDSFNAGACKQNWGMIKTCASGRFSSTSAAWSGMSSGSSSTRQADVQVYFSCRNYYGSNWFAGHRNGSSGLSNPNTQDIQNFTNGYNWTYNSLSGHESDNVRFWVNIPAI